MKIKPSIVESITKVPSVAALPAIGNEKVGYRVGNTLYFWDASTASYTSISGAAAGGTVPLIVKLTGTSVAAGGTQYADAVGSSGYSATETTRYTLVGVPYAVKAIHAKLNSTQPASGSLVVTLRKVGVSTSVALTIAGGSSAGIYSASGFSVTGTETEELNYMVKNNAATASGALLSLAIEIET